MADKYINETGLLTIRNWANGKFALDADLDALDARVDEIVAEGGEPNVIESISVNGTSVTPDAQKNVALTVPTATSDLTNDSNFAVDANYVHTDNNYTIAEKTKLGGVETGAEANVIEIVKVDGTALVPDAQKAVNIDLSGKADTSDIPTDLSDLTNTGADPYATQGYVDQNGGKIDVIKINGTTQTITNKEVDLTVPTFERNPETSSAGGSVLIKEGSSNIIEFVSLINEGAGSTDAYGLNVYSVNAPNKYIDIDLASIDYVDANGGKIDTISVNNTPQTITNKNVNITVPTKVSDITNDSNFQNDTQVDAKIASAVASAVTLKGSVATYSALPSTGQKHGDMYDVLDTGKNYVWIVEEGTGRWDDYAGTMDMSAYWTSTTGQTNTLEAMTVAEVNAILEPSA